MGVSVLAGSNLYFGVCFFVTDAFSPRHSTNPVGFALCIQLIENVGAFGDGIDVETVDIVDNIVAVGFYHGEKLLNEDNS